MNLITAYVRQIPRPVLVSVAVAAVVLVLYLSRPMALSKAVAAKLAVYPAGPRARFSALLAAFEAKGYVVTVTSTVRAGETGRHGTAHAIDINVSKGGKTYKMATPKADWEATGLPALARSMGFRWGGDFKTPYLHNGVMKPSYDPVHFDYAE